MPDIVDFKEVAVIEALVKPGDTVKPEQSLITEETDKASMEIPSSAGGVVAEIKVKIGDKVAEGSVVLSLETGADGKVQTIRFKNALIAAGSEAVKLPFLQTPQLRDDDRIVTSTGALALRQKTERMLVIGGGIIAPCTRRLWRPRWQLATARRSSTPASSPAWLTPIPRWPRSASPKTRPRPWASPSGHRDGR